MILLDAHCDTITRVMELNQDIFDNKCHIDIKRMKSTGYEYVQVFAAFIDPIFVKSGAMKRAVEIIDRFYTEIEGHNDEISICVNHEQITHVVNNGKIAALLSIEGGEALQGELSALRVFHRLGVRSIGLTWNHSNELADGVIDEPEKGHLKPFGKAAIQEMNRLGILVDLSHISPGAFWEAMEVSSSPVIASHSNARKICKHIRNLDDDQILAVCKRGGVIGINLYPEFLLDEGKASVSDIIRHIEHIAGLAGEDCIGIGADFDGIEKTPYGINGVEDMDKILNELSRLNYSSGFIEKFVGANFLRVIKNVCL